MDDFPNGGDSIRISIALNQGFDYQSTGSNYVWDFSSLIPNSQSVKEFLPMSDAAPFVQFMFGPFATSSYRASFFNAFTQLPIDQISLFLPVTIDNVYQYSRKTNDSLTAVGYSISINGTGIPFESEMIEKQYSYPASFGNSFTSYGKTTIDFNPIIDATWIQQKTRVSSIDGYGLLTTPFGTFDVVRIKNDINELDSIRVAQLGGVWFPLPVPLSHEYEWWTKNHKIPVLKITTTEIAGIENITSIEYQDIYRVMDASLSEFSDQQKISVFPNPASELLTISSEIPFDKIMITDLAGTVVLENCVQKQKTTQLTITSLKTGFYNLTIISGDKRIHKVIALM